MKDIYKIDQSKYVSYSMKKSSQRYHLVFFIHKFNLCKGETHQPQGHIYNEH